MDKLQPVIVSHSIPVSGDLDRHGCTDFGNLVPVGTLCHWFKKNVQSETNRFRDTDIQQFCFLDSDPLNSQ